MSKFRLLLDAIKRRPGAVDLEPVAETLKEMFTRTDLTNQRARILIAIYSDLSRYDGYVIERHPLHAIVRMFHATELRLLWLDQSSGEKVFLGTKLLKAENDERVLLHGIKGIQIGGSFRVTKSGNGRFWVRSLQPGDRSVDLQRCVGVGRMKAPNDGLGVILSPKTIVAVRRKCPTSVSVYFPSFEFAQLIVDVEQGAAVRTVWRACKFNRNQSCCRRHGRPALAHKSDGSGHHVSNEQQVVLRLFVGLTGSQV